MGPIPLLNLILYIFKMYFNSYSSNNSWLFKWFSLKFVRITMSNMNINLIKKIWKLEIWKVDTNLGRVLFWNNGANSFFNYSTVHLNFVLLAQNLTFFSTYFLIRYFIKNINLRIIYLGLTVVKIIIFLLLFVWSNVFYTIIIIQFQLIAEKSLKCLLKVNDLDILVYYYTCTEIYFSFYY